MCKRSTEAVGLGLLDLMISGKVCVPTPIHPGPGVAVDRFRGISSAAGALLMLAFRTKRKGISSEHLLLGRCKSVRRWEYLSEKAKTMRRWHCILGTLLKARCGQQRREDC